MRVITTVEALEALPRMSVVAAIHAVSNEPPIVLVWQRGSLNGLATEWCTPDTPGQIDSHRVFQFLLINSIPLELTVLWEPASIPEPVAQ